MRKHGAFLMQKIRENSEIMHQSRRMRYSLSILRLHIGGSSSVPHTELAFPLGKVAAKPTDEVFVIYLSSAPLWQQRCAAYESWQDFAKQNTESGVDTTCKARTTTKYLRILHKQAQVNPLSKYKSA